ncbi:MAG: NAD-dependent epimerase/dehydratase family protein, partial [Candidatus Aenigmatarchaeota archaeon]
MVLIILVTGCAGFIGFNLCQRLLNEGHEVLGVDKITNEYDIAIKQHRVAGLIKNINFHFLEWDISSLEKEQMKDIDVVFHQAAYANVRNSIENPMLFDEENTTKTVGLLKLAADSNVSRFVFASSAAIYGNADVPIKETAPLNPISPYGVSKLAAEKYCDAFFECYGLSTISLRYFTAYGPWGRPDMLILMSIASCLEGAPMINIFKNAAGEIVPYTRDFSYVDDIVEANMLAMKTSRKNLAVNIGAGKEVSVQDVIKLIENETGKSAMKEDALASPTDPIRSLCDITLAKSELGFEPKTNVEEGIRKTIEWYKQYKG